jgi:predicted NUDIX family NTP pyrophosphohydrolase
MKKSAGILLFRFKDSKPEFFLVHPGGPFWKNKDKGSWSIPKGEFPDEEEPFAAAKREFKEETGMELPGGKFIQLSPLKQRSGKLIYAWALELDLDAGKIKSNFFELAYPPGSDNKKKFPEIDKAAWFDFLTAKEKILPGQIGFIEEIIERMKK